MRPLQSQRPVGGAVDAALEFAQFDRREAHRAGQSLPVDERLGQALRAPRRHFDVIAEHVVVAHLERGDVGGRAVARLQGANQAPALVAQGHRLVERRVVTAGDDAAVGHARRRAGHERLLQALDDGLVVAQRARFPFEGRRRRPQVACGARAEGGPEIGDRAQRVAHRGQVARTPAPQA